MTPTKNRLFLLLCLSVILAMNVAAFERPGYNWNENAYKPTLSKAEASLLKKAHEWMNKNQNDRALDLLNEQLNDESSAVLHYTVAWLYYVKKESTKAIEHLNISLKKTKYFKAALELLSHIYYSQKEYVKYISVSTSIVQSGLASANTYKQRGHAFSRLGKFLSAQTNYHYSLTIEDSNNEESRLGLAKSYLELHQYENAAAIAEEMISRKPYHQKAWKILIHAQMYFKKNSVWETMEMAYRLNLLPDNLSLSLSDHYLNQGLLHLAHQRYHEYLKTKPLSNDKAIEIAKAFLSRTEFEMATDYISQIEKGKLSSNQISDWYYLKALVSMNAKDTEKVTLYFKKSIEKNPLNADSLFSYAQHLVDHKHFFEAENIIKRCLSLDTYVFESYLLLAKTYVELKQYKKAYGVLNKATLLKDETYVKKYMTSLKNFIDSK